mmetsp:Transcript_9000/g.19327  ORF Transcript_9000/g.19327 Transcript_9000/m.19327 type:complete len:205 (+) Transcript_9000:750-1364(+)
MHACACILFPGHVVMLELELLCQVPSRGLSMAVGLPDVDEKRGEVGSSTLVDVPVMLKSPCFESITTAWIVCSSPSDVFVSLCVAAHGCSPTYWRHCCLCPAAAHPHCDIAIHDLHGVVAEGGDKRNTCLFMCRVCTTLYRCIEHCPVHLVVVDALSGHDCMLPHMQLFSTGAAYSLQINKDVIWCCRMLTSGSISDCCPYMWA